MCREFIIIIIVMKHREIVMKNSSRILFLLYIRFIFCLLIFEYKIYFLHESQMNEEKKNSLSASLKADNKQTKDDNYRL